MEASWKQKKRRQKEAWLMVVAMSCGGKGHIGAPGMPKFRRLQVTMAQHHVEGKLVPALSPLKSLAWLVASGSWQLSLYLRPWEQPQFSLRP